MKKILLVSFLLSAQFALACPDLTGTYAVCKTNSVADFMSRENVVIKMTGSNSYLISFDTADGSFNEEVIADGKERTRTVNNPNGGRLRVKITSVCQANKLIITGKTRFLGIKMEEVTKLSKAGDDLLIETSIDGKPADVSVCRDL